MKWDTQKRKYWDVGNTKVFRLSTKQCQNLLHALVMCDGRLHDSYSMEVRHGEVKPGVKTHQIDACFRISLPEGAEETFESIMGAGTLDPPPRISLN